MVGVLAQRQSKLTAWFKEHYAGIRTQQQSWIDEAVRSKKVVLPHGFVFHFPNCKITGSGYVTDTTSICNFPVQHFATGEIIPIAVVYLWHLMRGMESFLVNTVQSIKYKVQRTILFTFNFKLYTETK